MAKGDSKPMNLGPLDAAIILREDGTLEVSLPDIGLDEEVPENVMTGAAVMYALQDQELCDAIHDHFLEECSQLDISCANDA